jgi:hypothetical protein
MTTAAQGGTPDLSGTWRLDRDLTTADLRWERTSILVVEQSGDEVRFDHYDGERFIGAERFIIDNTERPRYTTRLERAYARVKWDKNRLVVSTRSFLDVYGYQWYTMVDRWELSPDGETLSNKSSDGKVLVYNREHPSVPATSPPNNKN